MSAAPGGELAASLQRLANEVNIMKVAQNQQNVDLAQTNVELNSLRLNIPEASRHAVDEVIKRRPSVSQI